MFRLLLLAALSQVPTAPTFDLGINVTRNPGFDTAKLWVDQARYNNGAWLTKSKDVNGSFIPATTTPDGWPTQDAFATISFASAPPPGVYRLRHAGSGKAVLTGRGANAASNGPITTDANGVQSSDVTIPGTTGNANILITGIDPANPPTAMSLIPPGYDPTNPPVFRWDALRRFRLFKHYRFMDFQATNRTSATDYSARVKPTDWIQWGNNGVAHEFIVEFANILKPKSIWVCIPDTYTDDSIRRMADFFRDNLDPSINVKVQYSNELWNSGFPQWARNVAAAKADGRFTGPSDTQYGVQREAMRAVEIGRIWRAEYGPRAASIFPVMGGQNNLPYYAQQGIKFLQSNNINVAAELSILATAPYIDMQPSDDVEGLTPDGIFAAMAPRLAGRVAAGIQGHATLASSVGLAYEAYEGTQSINDFKVGVGTVNHAAKAAAQIDPRMASMNEQLFQTWGKLGGGTFVVYGQVASIWGSFGYWGQLPMSDVSGSVKWDGLLNRLIPPGDVNLDCSVDYADYLIIAANAGRVGPLWREDGDLNADGAVDVGDVTVFAASAQLTDPQRATISAAFPALSASAMRQQQ